VILTGPDSPFSVLKILLLKVPFCLDAITTGWFWILRICCTYPDTAQHLEPLNVFRTWRRPMTHGTLIARVVGYGSGEMLQILMSPKVGNVARLNFANSKVDSLMVADSGDDSCVCCNPAECQACSAPPELSSNVGLVSGAVAFEHIFCSPVKPVCLNILQWQGLMGSRQRLLQKGVVRRSLKCLRCEAIKPCQFGQGAPPACGLRDKINTYGSR
jgi:hypothetical protein